MLLFELVSQVHTATNCFENLKGLGTVFSFQLDRQRHPNAER
jgi:hypothetical protein